MSLINARTLALPFLVLLAPWFYGRMQCVPFFWQNTPSALPRHNVLGGENGRYEIKFADRVRSCEDVILLEDQGLALMGCDPGRERFNTVMGIFIPGPVTSADLYLYDYKSTSTPDAAALRRIELVGFDKGRLDFHTLGMSLHEESGTLFVSNHRRESPQPSIEVFKLDLTSLSSSFPPDAGVAEPPAPKAVHIRTITHPLIRGPNSIAVVSDTEFFVTNDHYFLVREHPLLSQLETYLAAPFGTVVHVKLPQHDQTDGKAEGEVDAKVVARLAYANGIEFLNATTLAVASTSGATVYLYTVTPSAEEEKGGSIHPRLLYVGVKIHVPFLPDNLSITGGAHNNNNKKKLLIAGHPHIVSSMRYAKTRHICNDPLELAMANTQQASFCADTEGANRATSWVSEWDPETGEVRHLFSGTEYPSSATAVEDAGRGVGIIAGLYAKGILVWRG